MSSDSEDVADPFGIVPEDFDYDSVREAAREAERGDDRECPYCGYWDYDTKLPADHPRAAPNRRDERYVCRGCNRHWDDFDAAGEEGENE